MKNSYSDYYEPTAWVHKSDFPGIEIEKYADNIFEMSILSVGEKSDESKLDEWEDVSTKFDLANHVLTLVQHQKNTVDKWIDKEKKVFNEKDVYPKYEYELFVYDKRLDVTAVFRIDLDKMQAVKNLPNGDPIIMEKDANSGDISATLLSLVDGVDIENNDSLSEDLEVIAVYDEEEENPFDLDFVKLEKM